MKNKTWLAFLIVSAILVLMLIVFAVYRFSYPLKFETEIQAASQEFNVEPWVVASIINAESSFDETALSKKGAVGLMQLIPTTAKWVVETNSNFETTNFSESLLYDPEINIRIGTCYFSYLMKKFNNLEVALCAYNAGEGTVFSWLASETISKDGKTLDEIPFDETKNYVEKVEKCLEVYRKKFS